MLSDLWVKVTKVLKWLILYWIWWTPQTYFFFETYNSNNMGKTTRVLLRAFTKSHQKRIIKHKYLFIQGKSNIWSFPVPDSVCISVKMVLLHTSIFLLSQKLPYVCPCAVFSYGTHILKMKMLSLGGYMGEAVQGIKTQIALKK